MMIERRAYNPVESILQFRRIVEAMSRMPGSLKVQNVAMHMSSNRMMQILDVDMVSFILCEDSDVCMMGLISLKDVSPPSLSMVIFLFIYAGNRVDVVCFLIDFLFPHFVCYSFCSILTILTHQITIFCFVFHRFAFL